MLYYFYGPDSYRRNQKLNSSVAEYRKKHPVSDMAVFDFEESPEDWIKAKDFLSQPSMFVDSKVLVVKNSNDVPPAGGGKEWIKVLKSNLETDRIFVLVSDAKKPLKAFEFLLEPPAKNDFFGELDDRLLEIFVKKEATARGITFEKNAEDFFLGYLSALDERSWVAINELEKISLLGPVQPVKLDDLKKIIVSASNDEVFKAARQIMWSRDWVQKIRVLERLLLQKKEAAYIFNSLAFLAKGREIIKMADYDVSIKSGNLDYEEALLDFILP